MTEPAVSVTIDDVRAAATRIAPFVHRTPAMTCSSISEQVGCDVIFKCENLQKVGAFKIRGATNMIMQLGDDAIRHGVVTHSSGNHAQATALAARRRGVPAHIIMPRTAPGVKRQAVIGYGGIVYECEPTTAARAAMAEDVQRRTGATFVPPYDHPDVIAGQGTVALELLDDAPDLDGIIAPIGGGGLIGGTCVATAAVSPHTICFGAEPSEAADAEESLRTGVRQPPVASPDTIADGLLTGLGERTWPIVREHVKEIATVNDEQIREAMRWINQRMKLIVEPSGAVALAAAMTRGFRSRWIDGGPVRRLGVIISGGNL